MRDQRKDCITPVVVRFFISKVGMLSIKTGKKLCVKKYRIIFHWVMKKQGCKHRQWSVQEGPGNHSENIIFYAMGNGGLLLDFR